MSKLSLRRFEPSSGWANVGIGLERALVKAGVEVVPHDQPAPVQLHVLPPHFYTGHFEGSVPWLFTMWETSEIPEGALQMLGSFHGVIVPNAENLEGFSRHHPNVHQVPIGIDPFWHPPFDRTARHSPFRWLYTPGGRTSDVRKGVDVLEKAAVALRGAGYDVEMVPAQAPTDEALRDLYWSCDAYVGASRGEGWGLMPHQALATGMPTVLSDCIGHREYSWLPGAFSVATTLVDSELTFHGPAGMWWEPDLDDLVADMALVMDNFAGAVDLALQAPKLVRDYFDWDKIGAKVIALLGDDLDGPDPTGPWVPPVPRLFQVRALKATRADIGEKRIVLAADEEAWVEWDQRRVLVEAGMVEAL